MSSRLGMNTDSSANVPAPQRHFFISSSAMQLMVPGIKRWKSDIVTMFESFSLPLFVWRMCT